MALDFQQVREQVKQLGENAHQSAQWRSDQRQKALKLLRQNASDQDRLYQKVKLVAHNYDANLRCALPVLQSPEQEAEPLDGHSALPQPPECATILAADGSQIAPDRHAAVNYCLINVGAIQLRLGLPQAPEISIVSQLLYDEELYTRTGMLTDARLALMRDLNERKRLAELAEQANAPVITFTDGPMELWVGREEEGDDDFKESLNAYLDALRHLEELQVATAGYVDKPAATLVTRLLEVAMTAEDELVEFRHAHPLRPVIDIDLFRELLAPGERWGVFGLQSRAAARYSGRLALHFFYLNVGREGHPWLARVEIPAWVAANCELLDFLHAVLVQQCRVMGSRPYPYVLHRAHEAALVKLEEKDQVTQMIVMELRQRGVEVGEVSYKQSAKDLSGRTRYGK
jgi:hypothetical protein